MKLAFKRRRISYPPPEATVEYPLFSLHLSYAGLTAAQTNKLTVAPMNNSTTA